MKKTNMGEERPTKKTKSEETSEVAANTTRIPKIPDIYFLTSFNSEKWYAIKSSSNSYSRSLEPALPPLPEPIEKAAYASIGSKIYASGGLYRSADEWTFYDPIPSNKVFYIDTHCPKEGWKEAAPMNAERNSHYMIADAGKLYVLGGLLLGRHIDSDEKRLFAEVYDPNSNTWEELVHIIHSDITDMGLPNQVYGHAVVNDNSVRKILFHAYSYGSLFYINTHIKNDVGVHNDRFGKYHSPSTFEDGVLYFLRYNSIYACDVSSNCSDTFYECEGLDDVEIDILPHHNYFMDESRPTSELLALGNGYLALIWAKQPEDQNTYRNIHCSILEMSRVGDTFEAKVLSYSPFGVDRGSLDDCIAVFPS